MTDASAGVTNPGYRPGDTAVALPASIVLGASFNLPLSREAGTILGREARVRGFNVMLGGGINLARPPKRPELRVLLRGSAGERRPRCRSDQRNAGRRGYLDDQAPLPQCQRNQ